MKVLIQFNDVYIYSKLNRHTDSSILISSSTALKKQEKIAPFTWYYTLLDTN